jgi:RHS repeat-associated protein
LKNGTVLVFLDGLGAERPTQAALTAIRDRYGNTLQLTRDPLNFQRLTAINSPNGRWIRLAYDASSRVTQATDNMGRTATYSYDSSGRLASVIDPAGGKTTYTYDASDNMLSFTDARGIVYSQNHYDSHNRVISQTLASGGTYKFAYMLNSLGDVIETQVTNPLGVARKVTFNSAGYTTTDVRAVGKPEQQTSKLEWQAKTNLPLSFTDALGRKTVFAYNTSGDLTQVTRLAGTSLASVTSFTYEPEFHQVMSVTDALGHTHSFTRDVTGNLIEEVDPLGNKWNAAYNGAGQATSLTDPLGNTTGFAYLGGDSIGITDPLGHTVSRIVDGAGRTIAVTDALGDTTRFSYDVLNQPTKIVNALAGVTKFSYDVDGDLLSITDPLAHTNTYTYDTLDRLISGTDPLSRKETYGYDLLGNVKQFTDRRGTNTIFSYDGLNRVVSKAFAQGGVPTSTIVYTYDAGNRLTKFVDSRSGTIKRTYDDLNEVSSESTPQGTVIYTYDLLGRRTSMTASGQSVVDYTYDNDDRLTRITQATTRVLFTYDGRGRRVSVTLPNGVVKSYTYDQASRITALKYADGVTAIGVIAYTYDAANRRTSASGTLANLILPAALSAVTYDGANELKQSGSTLLTYDANGNLAREASHSYTWNDRNQLIQIVDSGVSVANFQYDSFGRRIVRATGGPATSYLFDGMNVVQQKSNTTANLLTGLRTDEIFSRTDITGSSVFLTDALGSTVALTGVSGTIQTEYGYAPFGDTITSGSASTNPFQFTGRENDGTGLYYYRARYYSPLYSRFISEDPLRFGAGDANFYSYTHNSPTNFTDPTGRQFLPGCVLGAVAGAGLYYLSGAKATVGGYLSAAGLGCLAAGTLGALGGLEGAAITEDELLDELSQEVDYRTAAPRPSYPPEPPPAPPPPPPTPPTPTQPNPLLLTQEEIDMFQIMYESGLLK